MKSEKVPSEKDEGILGEIPDEMLENKSDGIVERNRTNLGRNSYMYYVS